jgi:hypothetical protein
MIGSFYWKTKMDSLGRILLSLPTYTCCALLAAMWQLGPQQLYCFSEVNIKEQIAYHHLLIFSSINVPSLN